MPVPELLNPEIAFRFDAIETVMFFFSTHLPRSGTVLNVHRLQLSFSWHLTAHCSKLSTRSINMPPP